MSFLPISGMANSQHVERMPINPLDKSTVVSIYPRMIKAVKETIQPGTYILEPGSYDKPFVLVVGSASWWRNIIEMPSLEIPTGSPQVANAIVEDYCIGLPGYENGLADPGLFWLPGEVTVIEVKTKHKAHLDAALVRQKKYFTNVVERADVDWARTNGNPRAVSDVSRMAAEQLGLKNKAWMQDFQTLQMVNCPACGVLKRPEFPICANCKTDVTTFVKK